MTKSQLLEAAEIFEATLDDDYRAKLARCEADLAVIRKRHGIEVYRDATIRMYQRVLAAADRRGDEVWTIGGEGEA